MKTYETWQVVKALRDYIDWFALAPDTSELWPARASTNEDGDVIIDYGGPVDRDGQTIVSQRSDWRLYDSNGNEVTDYE